jgi:phenylalanyl-tRNA synthetase alpha chain
MSTVMEKLEGLKSEAVREVALAADTNAVYQLKSRYIGKKSEISELLKGLAALSIEEKRSVGGRANAVKDEIEALIEERIKALLAGGPVSFDPDLPGLQPALGRLHPLTLVMRDIKNVFVRMGFAVAEGPEVETDHYNFEALNMPKHHPARDMHDTFFLSPEVLLRTHTSPVQVRVMEKQKPPIRIIAPGRVYRHDFFDASHSPVFSQVEGLYVDEGVSFAGLKGTLDTFVKTFFGPAITTRFRPSFFPFTEPSAEMDVRCILCGGPGCPVCKRTGWIEIMGCGMVDPNVFKAVGIDPEKYTGFAFGMGVERIAMLKFGIDDIRLFFENDKRFLEQFA